MTASANASASLTGNISASGSLPPSVMTALSQAGIPTTGPQLQAAVTQVTGIDASAQNAALNVAGSVGGLLSGGVSVDSVAPLLAAGFAATGVGAPIAAAITLGLPLVQSLGNLLNKPPKVEWYYRANQYGPPSSDFEMGAKQGSKAPYGTKDPNWRTFDQVVPVLDVMAKGLSIGAKRTLDDVNPGLAEQYAEYKDNSHQTYGVSPAANTFRKVYNAAWRANYEFVINGHDWVDPYVLLTTVATAWNATHAPTSTVTLTNSGPSYISHLLNGDYDHQDHPPVTINTGAATGAAPAPGASSTLQKAVAAHALTLRAAGGPPTAVGSAGGMTLTHTLEGDVLKWLPLLPAAVGLALIPVAGPFAAAVGGVVSALWWEIDKHSWWKKL